MIHKKDIASAKCHITAILYCDERRIVQIVHKNGGLVEEFHGVPYDLFYGYPSGPTAPLAIRQKLWGRFLYRIVPASEAFLTNADIMAQEIAEELSKAKQENEKLWQEEREKTAQLNLPSASVLSATKPGAPKKKRARAVADLLNTESSPQSEDASLE